MQEHTAHRPCRKCGRTALAPELGVLTGRTADGKTAGSRGQMTCGSIWLCAVCESAKRAEDTSELTTAALRWLAKGGTLAAVVLTTRHNRTHKLDDLVGALWGKPDIDQDTGEVRMRKAGKDANGDTVWKPARVPGAYQQMLVNQKFRRTIAPSIGYVGMARNPEVTRSEENGWNPHVNALVFLGGTLDGTPANGKLVYLEDPETGETRCTFAPAAEDLESWEDWLRDFWQDALRSIDPDYTPTTECERANCKCEGKGHGVSVKIITSADDEALIRYLTKSDDKPAPPVAAGAEAAAVSVATDIDVAQKTAAEVAYTTGKNARGRRSMTPFQFLDRLWAIDRDGMTEDQAPGYGTRKEVHGWWGEYDATMPGRRAFEMTRGLRRHTDLDSDEDYRFEDQQAKFVAGVVLTADAHDKVTAAEADYTVIEAVRDEREADVPALVADAGGHADHVRLVDEDGCAEFLQSLSDVVKAKAKNRLTEAEALMRGMTRATCARCSGTGHLEEFAAVADGSCFGCCGTGWTWTQEPDDPDEDDPDEEEDGSVSRSPDASRALADDVGAPVLNPVDPIP
ncbi:replication protein (plasmid) [Streptomycetaceae bacterium NBC_01309]